MKRPRPRERRWLSACALMLFNGWIISVVVLNVEAGNWFAFALQVPLALGMLAAMARAITQGAFLAGKLEAYVEFQAHLQRLKRAEVEVWLRGRIAGNGNKTN